MKARRNLANDLELEVEDKKWQRRKIPFTNLTSDQVLDFPELNIQQLTLFMTGTYQLHQAISYLGEMMHDNNDMSHIPISVLKNDDTAITKTLKCLVQSRHINAKKYRVFIRYYPSTNSIDGICSYCCECANGTRTIGCCSHISALIFYLSHARYQSKFTRPNEILTSLFDTNTEIVIDEDSDED